MLDMKKEHRQLVRVKNLDDHYTSVLSALNVNLMHKAGPYATLPRETPTRFQMFASRLQLRMDSKS